MAPSRDDGVGGLVHRRVHDQVRVVGHRPLQRVDRPGALSLHHVHPAGDAEEGIGVAARAGHDERVATDDEHHPAAGERGRPLLGGPHGGLHLPGQPLAGGRVAERRAHPAGRAQHVGDAHHREGQDRHAQLGDAPDGREGAPVGEPEDEVGAEPQHGLGTRVEEAAHAGQGLHLG